MRLLHALCSCLALVACNLASGVDDFRVRDAGAGGGIGASSAGGSALGGSDGGIAGGGSEPAPCLVALRDDFDGAAIDTTKWLPIGSVEQTGGELRTPFEWGTLIGNYAAVRSLTPLDMSGCGAIVEVTQGFSTPGSELYLLATPDAAYWAGIRALGGELQCYSNDGLGATAPYDATAHRWWRIESQSGALGCATSPDGVSWQLLGTAIVSIPSSATFIEIGAGTPGGPSGGEARFDNLNVPPP